MDPIEIAKVTPNPSHTPTELKEVLFSHSQSVHSLTPKIPGVYFLFSGKEIVYVGQSTHVPGRIATHVLERKINFDRVAYLSISPNELLLEESRYISMFKPKYNRTGIYDKERENNESKNSTTIVMKVSANKFRFSDANIGKIPRSEIRMKLWDSETNGLCIRVGSKKIFYVAKKKNGKDLYIRLGEFPYMTVEEARKEAHRVLAKISRDSNKKREHVYAEAFFLDLFENYMENKQLASVSVKQRKEE